MRKKYWAYSLQPKIAQNMYIEEKNEMIANERFAPILAKKLSIRDPRIIFLFSMKYND